MTESGGVMNALILSGGAAYAAYEVGVMKALFYGRSPSTGYEPLDPQVFTGTSAGAFNAAYVISEAADKEPASAIDNLEDLWLNRIAEGPGACGNGMLRYRGNPFNFFDLDCVSSDPARPFVELADDATFFAQDWLRRGVNFFNAAGTLEQRTLELIDLGTLVSNEPLGRTVRENIRLDAIRQSGHALRIIATNWRTGDVKVFGNADMTEELGHRVVMASAAVPGLFPPVEVGGEPYVDGGVVMNTPLRPAIDAGGEVLHVVYMDPDVQIISLPRIRNTVSTAYRLLVIGFGAFMARDIEIARRINQGLDVITKADGDEPSGQDARAFILVAASLRKRMEEGRSYKKLTIHRYHPRDDLGGAFRWMTFDRDYIARLIDVGYRDAAEHDCVLSRCILA